MRLFRIFTAALMGLMILLSGQTASGATTHTVVFLVRHGQSLDNATGLQSGWSTAPITALGQRQATAIGSKLKDVEFIAAYSSGSVRAVQTLEAMLALRTNPIQGVSDQRFREWGAGSFDQKPVALLQAAEAKKLKTSVANLWKFTDEAKFNAAAAADPTKKAETWTVFKTRILAGAKALVKNNPSGSVLVVSHGYVIKHLIKLLTGSYSSSSISNTSVTVLDYSGGKWTLLQAPTLNPKLPISTPSQ